MKLPGSIRDTQQGLVKGDFSAVDLVDGYLSRIKKLNKNLNAFITVSENTAYKQAKKTDKRIKQLGKNAFEEKPLLGSVVAYKDIFLTKGIRTTAASKVLENYVPAYSATVVKKLEESGCIMIGKTNCDAWAHGASGELSDFGPTKNPWNEEYVPGGSSSGSAVSVSAKMSLISAGTDTGGSIRYPSSFCSVVGLKPTYGSVSRYGIIAMASSTDSVGHFARDVVDIENIYKVTKGVDRKDSNVKDENNKPIGKGFKIGIPKEYFTEGLDRQVKESVLKAISVYKKSGVNLVDISLPHTKYAISSYYIIQPSEVSSNLSRYDGIRYGNDRNHFGDEAKRRIMLGTFTLSTGYYEKYYLKAMKVRTKVIEDFNRAFENIDAIIAPVSPTPPFKIGEKVNDPLKMYLSDVYMIAANLSGIPGLAIPSGFSKNNLPLGFQLIGPRFSENTLFTLGKMYQEKTDYHLKEPNL